MYGDVTETLTNCHVVVIDSLTRAKNEVCRMKKNLMGENVCFRVQFASRTV